MKSNNQGWLSKALMLTLGAFMLFSASAVTASAQDRDWRRDDHRREDARRREEWRERREAQRRAQQQQQYGYYGNNGYYNNNGYYRNNGYYNNGYNNGYYNNGYYGYNNNFTQTALNAGYNAGVQEGRRDRSRGTYRDVNSFSEFRNADKDYNSRLGDRYTYQQYYRQGFINGYRDGLNGY